MIERIEFNLKIVEYGFWIFCGLNDSSLVCLFLVDLVNWLTNFVIYLSRDSSICQLLPLISRYDLDETPKEEGKTLRVLFSAQSTEAIIYVVVSISTIEFCSN